MEVNVCWKKKSILSILIHTCVHTIKLFQLVQYILKIQYKTIQHQISLFYYVFTYIITNDRKRGDSRLKCDHHQMMIVFFTESILITQVVQIGLSGAPWDSKERFEPSDTSWLKVLWLPRLSSVFMC